MALRPYSQALQEAYRDTLGTPGAPEVIDDATPVMPVAVVAQVNTQATASYTQITDGTNTLSIESTGALTPFKATATIAEGTINGAGSTTIGTVGVGKVWRILSVWIAGTINNGATEPNVTLNGVVALRIKCQAGATTYSPYFPVISWDYSACPVLTAGQTAVVTNPGAGMQTYAGISYVEEDA